MWPPRIIANESALEKKPSPGSCDGLLAGVDEVRVDLVRPSGNGPMPSKPFSDWRVTSIPSRDVVRDERRDADPEIDVVAVAQLPGAARRAMSSRVGETSRARAAPPRSGTRSASRSAPRDDRST